MNQFFFSPPVIRPTCDIVALVLAPGMRLWRTLTGRRIHTRILERLQRRIVEQGTLSAPTAEPIFFFDDGQIALTEFWCRHRHVGLLANLSRTSVWIRSCRNPWPPFNTNVTITRTKVLPPWEDPLIDRSMRCGYVVVAGTWSDSYTCPRLVIMYLVS